MWYTIERWDSYNGRPADLEKILNQKAKQGWRLISTSTGSGNNVYLFFESEGESKEENYSFDVILENAGSNKLAVVKGVKEVFDIGLKEAKEVVDVVPVKLIKGVTIDIAEVLKRRFEEFGAIIKITPA